MPDSRQRSAPSRGVGRRMRINGWRAPALALAVLVSAASLFGLLHPFSSLPPRVKISPLRADLVGALGAVRLTEARLAGFRYAPFQGRGAPPCRACVPIARAIASQAERQPTAVALADLGVEQLAARRLREAVGTLERAAARNPEDPVAENDLAAAYVAQSRAEDRPHLLLQALEALARTNDLSPEARFNHAFVLDLLQLRSEATKAWRRYLSDPHESGWHREALQRLSSLTAPTLAAQWRTERPILEAAAQRGDSRAVAGIVGRFRQESRSLGQEVLLPAWGRSYLRGDAAAAARTLDIARCLGAVLEQVDGEHSVADAVAAIEHARGHAGAGVALARGHAAYGEGFASFVELRVGEARARLDEAERGFRAGGSPAVGWAQLWLAGADYYQGRHADATARLENLLANPEIARFPALRGRAFWESGLVEMHHLAIGRSLARFQAAVSDFSTIGELENSGAVSYLLAENFEMLGEPQEAWKYREQGLASLRGYPDSIPLHNLLLEASRALERQGLIHAALAVQGEELTVARQKGRPVTLAEALLLKARIESKLGEEAQASRDLNEAGSAVAAIADTMVRQRLKIESMVARSQIVIAHDPAAVVQPMTEAISYYTKANLGNLSASAYLLRARARLALHDDPAAEADLRSGIEAYETARTTLDPEWLRVTFLEQWQPLFDEMIELQAIRRQRPEEALDFAERAKVGLLCRPRGEGEAKRAAEEPICRGSGRASLETIQGALPERSALVEYALLQNRLLIWVVRRHSLSLVAHPVGSQEMEHLAAGMLSALREDSPAQESRQAGAALFEHLLRPVAARLEDADRLIIVPDKVLSAVPFAALYDPAHASYLVERWPLSVEPGASFYVARRREPPASPRQWRLLAVAPAQPAGLEKLGGLPGAAAEAAETAELFPRHRLLAGEEATRSRFLSAMRAADAVEFAGHAIANPEQPSLSRLVLSPDPAASGSTMLFARELRRVPLGHLHLVVLSACATAPGSRARGEGVAGMAQAFLEAGASAVLATLWRVDDAAARCMVIEFHRQLLAGQDGASAVRAAQLALLHDRDETMRKSSGWAAFELVGALMEPEN